MVVFDERGVSDFGALQRALKEGPGAVTYVAFDLLFEDGEDLRELPLRERKRRLRAAAQRGGRGPRDVVRYGDHIDGRGAAVFEEACLQRLEGVVSKRAGGALRRPAHPLLAQDQVRPPPGVRGRRLHANRPGRAAASAPSSSACTTRRARCATPDAWAAGSTTPRWRASARV